MNPVERDTCRISHAILWNSSSVASSLATYIQSHNLETLEEAHTDIMLSTLHVEPTDAQTWLAIFDVLKDYLYVGLCDPDICYSCIQILKSLLTAKVLTDYTVKKFKDTFLKALHLLFVSVQDQTCRVNTSCCPCWEIFWTDADSRGFGSGSNDFLAC